MNIAVRPVCIHNTTVFCDSDRSLGPVLDFGFVSGELGYVVRCRRLWKWFCGWLT